MKMLGLVFADEHDADISELTAKRTFAALPFGARYRIIDFFISNMTNSGIQNIGVVATTKYESLMGHVRYGGEWDLHRSKSGLTVLPPFSFFNGEIRYENVLEALQANISYIEKNTEPYILFTCCNAIGNIDYSAMLEQHIKTGARFTCLCTKHPVNKGSDLTTTEYVLDSDGRIKDIVIHNKVTPGAYVATNTYIMAREDLLDILQQSIDQNKTSLRNDILKPALDESLIMAYVGNYTTIGEPLQLNFASFFVVAGGILGGALVEYFCAILTDNTIDAAKIMADVGDKQMTQEVLDGKAKPDYNMMIAMAAKEAIHRMVLPSVLALLIPIVGGFILGVEFVGGILVGATIVAIPRAIFMGNSGGAFDNAKKYIEQGMLEGHGKGSPAHKAAVTGDTIGDTRKDVVGVALDIFIKLMSTVANTIAPIIRNFRIFG